MESLDEFQSNSNCEMGLAHTGSTNEDHSPINVWEALHKSPGFRQTVGLRECTGPEALKRAMLVLQRNSYLFFELYAAAQSNTRAAARCCRTGRRH